MRIQVLLILIYILATSGEVVVKETWDGGFLADLVLHAPRDVDSWKVHVVFSHPVDKLSIWDGRVVSKLHGGREYVIANKNYNGHLKSGQTIKMEVDCESRDSNTISGHLFFEGQSPSNTQHPTVTTSAAPSTSPTSSSFSQHVANHQTIYNYSQLLDYSILFYEAQRSGKLPPDNRIPWRGDSALGDKGEHGEDLTGGWYDAGDHVKFNFPMASSVTWLTWGLLKFKDAYSASGQLDHMYSCIKWPLDYFLKCWIPSKQELYVQIGKGETDHGVWGRAEDMTMTRPAYKVTPSKPGSDVAGQMAAAMAAGSIAFATKDPAYSHRLLSAARGVYQFAKTHQGKYSDSVPDAKLYYESSDYKDELSLAAAWLYKASHEAQFLRDAEHFVPQDAAWALDWDDKGVATQMLLYEMTKKQKYSGLVEDFLKDFMPGGSVPYTPCGLVFRDKWGPNSYSGNAAMLALIAAEDGLNPDKYRAWARGQISYVLGENKQHMSYVVGYGNTYPLHVHHAGSSCPDRPAPCDWDNFKSPSPNPQILYGALVGGPDAHDNYKDARDDYIHNEVADDYNAGFQSAVAGLFHLQLQGTLPAAHLRGCD